MRNAATEPARQPAADWERTDNGATPFADRGCRVYTWSEAAILSNAPARPGVYGLFNALWIYIGDADDIRARLLEHAGGDNPCIAHYRPSGFAFEVIDNGSRAGRRDEIAGQLEPLCNGNSLVNRHNGVHKHHGS